MSKRAEQSALKAYPEDWQAGYFDDPDEVTDDNEEAREYFQQGYEQAEKDTIERAKQWIWQRGFGKMAVQDFQKFMEEE